MVKKKINKVSIEELDNILDLIKKWSQDTYNIDIQISPLLNTNLHYKSKFKIRSLKLKTGIRGPTSAFIYFTQDQILKNNENNIFKTKKNELSDIWSNMTKIEKEPYIKLALLDRSRYNKLIENYIKQIKQIN